MTSEPSSLFTFIAPTLYLDYQTVLYNQRLIINNGMIMDIINCQEKAMQSNQIILPPFLNAHTHLDLTNVQSTNHEFYTWAKCIGNFRQQATPEDILASYYYGEKLALYGGARYVSDVNGSGMILNTEQLRVFESYELIGAETSEPINKKAIEAYKNIVPVSLTSTRVGRSFSPHAPYSTSAKLYQYAAHQQRDFSLVTHVFELPDEQLYYKYGQGPLQTFMKQVGVVINHPLNPLTEFSSALKKSMLIHANYVNDSDLSVIKSLEAAIVFCPRSHDYFGHSDYPLKNILDYGIPMMLGTDSLASNSDLSIFEEAKYAQTNYNLSDEILLKMLLLTPQNYFANRNIGKIQIGMPADFLVINTPTTIFGSQSKLCEFYINGLKPLNYL